jgi:hypothetical protein
MQDVYRTPRSCLSVSQLLGSWVARLKMWLDSTNYHIKYENSATHQTSALHVVDRAACRLTTICRVYTTIMNRCGYGIIRIFGNDDSQSCMPIGTAPSSLGHARYLDWKRLLDVWVIMSLLCRQGPLREGERGVGKF